MLNLTPQVGLFLPAPAMLTSGVTVVVFQNTAESMFVFDLARIKRNGVVFIIRFTTRQRQQFMIMEFCSSACWQWSYSHVVAVNFETVDVCDNPSLKG